MTQKGKSLIGCIVEERSGEVWENVRVVSVTGAGRKGDGGRAEEKTLVNQLNRRGREE